MSSLCPGRRVLPRWLYAIALFTALATATAAPAAAATDAAPVAADVGHELGLQTKLPTDPDTSKPKDDEESNPSDFRIHLSGATSSAILWVALACGLAFALYALRDTFPTLSRKKKLRPGALPVTPIAPAAVVRMEATAIEADDLARRGLFAEAMHMLLLRSLVELRKRLNVTFADSLTSREILGRLNLPDNGRGALADLIGRVEFAYFGGQNAEPDDYKACRSSYERLTGAMIAESRA